MTNFKYAIIGGGLAAGSAAQVFAEAGLSPHEVAIFSAEDFPPYHRPPLSKDYLAGDETAVATLINDPEFYAENGIALYLNTPVTNIDLDQRKLFTKQGTFGFEKLLIATGASARRLDNVQGHNLDGIHYLRQLADARQIRSDIEDAKHAVVIGGSFIGMEVASILAQKGVATTLAFRNSRVFAGLFTTAMSEFFESYYKERGVTILPDAEIVGFTGANGRVQAVQLAQQENLPADLVVAGIGVTPNVELFQETPLTINEGIVVNRFLEASMPGIYAAGDVAEYHDVIFDRTRRIEHWDNAQQQGQHAASVMLGKQAVFAHVPYFFSDVFDLSYEFWGDPEDADTIIHRGDVENGRFSVWWIHDAKLKAAFIMNRPDEERKVAPEWIKSGVDVNVARLADAEQPLAAATG